MARMDYVIICRVIALLGECGITDDELSFLLGKANNYVFSFIVKPSDKNRFTEDQLDLLPYILNCSFADIIPNGTEKGNIQLYHTKRIDDEYKGFSHIIYDATGEGTRVIWRKKKAPKGSTRKTNEKLLDLLKRWTSDGYFDKKRTGLDIYKALISTKETNFRINELEKCLKVLAGTQHAIICKKPLRGVLMYWKRTP